MQHFYTLIYYLKFNLSVRAMVEHTDEQIVGAAVSIRVRVKSKGQSKECMWQKYLFSELTHVIWRTVDWVADLYRKQWV